jgi:hypothetical protein
VFVGLTAAVLLTGCQVEKSSNPLSPAIAGPVEGVVISHPNLLEPGQDWELKTRDQPFTLLIANAGTNGARPLKYSFQIASDAEFKNLVFARTGVEPGENGVTRLQLPDKLPAGTYWWRTRAEDGANIGPYSPVKSFQVLAPVVVGAPTLLSPSNGTTIGGLMPEFRVRAGERRPHRWARILRCRCRTTRRSRRFATFVKVETWPETTIATGYSFLYSKTYWRARARHMGEGSDVGGWSQTFTFRTPAPAPPALRRVSRAAVAAAAMSRSAIAATGRTSHHVSRDVTHRISPPVSACRGAFRTCSSCAIG